MFSQNAPPSGFPGSKFIHNYLGETGLERAGGLWREERTYFSIRWRVAGKLRAGESQERTAPGRRQVLCNSAQTSSLSRPPKSIGQSQA